MEDTLSKEILSSGGLVIEEEKIRKFCKELVKRPMKDTESNVKIEDILWWRQMLINVIRTSEEVRITNLHRAAVFDALSGLIKSGIASSDIRWSHFCIHPVLWKRILSMYFDRSSDATAKSLKKVLDTLMSVLKQHQAMALDDFHVCISQAASICTRSLFDKDASNSARPFMLVLDRLLRDGFISRAEILSIVENERTVKSELGFSTEDESFVYCCLLWARNPDLANVVGNLLSSFCAAEQKRPSQLDVKPNVSRNCWAAPLRTSLSEHPEMIGTFERHILPTLLRIDKVNGIAFSQELPFQDLWNNSTSSISETDIRLSLMFLRINEELSLDLVEHGQKENSVGSLSPGRDTLSFEERILVNLLSHPEAEIKLSALSLLIERSKSTQPINSAVICSISSYLGEFFNETDVKIRNEFTSLLRRFFKRLELISWRLEKMGVAVPQSFGQSFWRDALNANIEDEKMKMLANVGFLSTCQDLLLKELAPTASYQRHIMALRTFSYLKALRLPDSLLKILDLSAQSFLQPFVNLIMDRFEDVRALAAQLAANYFPGRKFMDDALISGEKLMRTSGRADHADGFGRLVKVRQIWESKESFSEKERLTCSEHVTTSKEHVRRDSEALKDSLSKYLAVIEQIIESAERDLRGAITDAPLHGNIIGLRYLVASSKGTERFWETPGAISSSEKADTLGENEDRADEASAMFCNRVGNLCERIWKIVYPILCDDSPEGTDFLGVDDEEEAVDVGLKDTLSYAWRALKESSLLIEAVLKMIEHTSCTGSVDIRLFGDLLFAQLAQLRHRGAFSAVAQAFTSFCTFSARHRGSEGNDTIQSIYSKTLDCILEKGTALTRRSAGLPALIVGLLCANPDGKLTAMTFKDLMDITQRPAESENAVGLPQVHALNCLKDIFSSSKLGSITVAYLSDTLLIAVNCLDNDIWAIRNSGLMLLKALLIRLEDGRLVNLDKARAGKRRIFIKSVYAKHPMLLEVVLDLLSTTEQIPMSSNQETSQARLVEKTFPAIEIIERVGVPAAVEVKIKDLLAFHLSSRVWAMRNKAAGCLALFTDAAEMVSYLKSAISQEKQNFMHGRLLLLRHFLREMSSSDDSGTITDFLLANSHDLELKCSSFACQELLYEIIMALLVRSKENAESKVTNLNDKLVASFPFLACEDPTSVLSGSRETQVVESKTKLWIYLKSLQGIGYKSILKLKDLGPTAIKHGLCVLSIEDQGNHPDINADDIGILLQLSKYVQASDDSETVQSFVECLTKALQAFAARRHNDGIFLANYELEKTVTIWVHLSASQELSNSVLKLWGAFVAFLLLEPPRQGVDSWLQRWFSLLRSAMKEEMDTEVRQAALDSFEIFKGTIKNKRIVSKHKKDLLPLLLFLYDGVSDDDEDVRFHAATLASWVLPQIPAHSELNSTGNIRSNPVLSSLAVRQILLKTIPQLSGPTRDLANEALSRIAGSNIDYLLLTPYSEHLSRAEKKSMTLFDEERQNQYLDEAQEADDWLAILKSMPAEMMDAVQIEKLASWTHAGTSRLISVSEARGQTSILGPLGLLSQPDAFLLTKRLLALASESLRVKCKTRYNGSGAALLDAVQSLVDLAIETAGNDRSDEIEVALAALTMENLIHYTRNTETGGSEFLE